MPRYRPFDDAARIGCPRLVMVADHDDVTPSEQAARLARAAPRVEMHRLATGPFEVYTGEWFEYAVDIHTDFLRRHLLDNAPAPMKRERRAMTVNRSTLRAEPRRRPASPPLCGRPATSPGSLRPCRHLPP